MSKLICLALLGLLIGCTDMPPRQNGCIPGDPSGSMACQALTYRNVP